MTSLSRVFPADLEAPLPLGAQARHPAKQRSLIRMTSSAAVPETATPSAAAAPDPSRTALGIELGSTRIKAVLIDRSHAVIASGGFEWANELVNRV